jgi:carboxyl-terminal processing protease
MRSRVFITITGVLIAAVLLSGACSAGFLAGRFYQPPEQIAALLPGGETNLPESSADSSTTADLQELFSPFWQTWDLIHDEFVDQPVDDVALMRGAIQGMLDSLGDPHTSYMDPEQFKELTTSLEGDASYEGIGAWVDTTAEYLTIISPIPGSPAEAAELRTGDQIIGVDGESMAGVDGELVRQKVLGPAGSTVTLTILRSTQEPFDIDIIRASITIPSVDYRMLDNDIAYVRVLIFADNTEQQLEEALKDVMSQNPRGLILDLRNNGGGRLISSIEVASQFISEGVIVTEEYGNGESKDYEARRGGLATDIPMVVLINEGSASASEIVAGAIQDQGRGKLVGMTSFGKGSVQLPTPLKDDQGAVRITIARWLTPNGRTIHGTGLTPDIEIPITEEDFTQNRDPQLDKAVELLTQ